MKGGNTIDFDFFKTWHLSLIIAKMNFFNTFTVYFF